MAYNENFPADDSYLSDFPAGDREQNRALKDDQIVNAGQLQGLTAGNENGQIPINNGTENTNLNAALLNGKASSYFATSNHTHDTATQSSNGYMSNADKKKLDGIASGAEVNQNTFANVKVGSNTIQADAKQDTLELVAGTNISLVGDANNDKVTIGVTGTVAKASQDSDGNAINTTYLKRSGGTMSGALNLANKTLNLAGDDCYFGDQDIAGGFCLKGANGTTNLTLINKDNATQKASLSYAGGNLISSATIQGNLSGTATNANNLDIIGSYAHIKYGGGDVDENTAISQNKVNLLIGSWYSTGFRDLCSSGTPIRVAINHRTGNIKTTGAVTASGGFSGNLTGNATSATNADTVDGKHAADLRIQTNFLASQGGAGHGYSFQNDGAFDTGMFSNSDGDLYFMRNGAKTALTELAKLASPAFTGTPTAPTQGTGDNSTRIATTAFVQSLLNSKGTIIASNLNENGYVKFSNGFIIQWGKVNLTNSGWEGEVGPFNFPISFSSSCFFVLPSMGNSDGGNPKSYDSSVQQRRWNNSQFWLYQQDLGGHPWFAFAHYIAFGR